MSEIPEVLAAMIGGAGGPKREPTVRHLAWSENPAGHVALVPLPSGVLSLPELNEALPTSVMCEHTDEEGRVEFCRTQVHMAPAGPANQQATGVSQVQWMTRSDVQSHYVGNELLLSPATRAALLPDGAGGESVAASVRTFAVKSPTLPPASHTNCHVLSSASLGGLVIDPASTSEAGHDALAHRLDRWTGRFGPLAAVVLTHHHADHIGGAAALRQRLNLPIWAHQKTSDRVPFDVDRVLAEDEVLGDWSVVFTPGHAPGHICLWNRQRRLAVVGDMIASVGTIIVEPRDGDMAAYIDSLRRLLALDARVLYPAHGAPITGAKDRINHYIDHRLWRESQVLDALAAVPQTVAAVRALAYPEIAPHIAWLADQSTAAHLIKLQRESRASRVDGLWSRA